MIEAENALKDSTVTSTQMHYNVVHRDIEKDIIPHCIEKKIAVMAYYPLAHGKLGSDTAMPDKIDKISKSHGGKTLSQITLNWFYSKNGNVFPIPRASNQDHVKENCGSLDFTMSTEEIGIFEESVRLM
jgi:diketogulonate reductase-like aldo/keto reductase